MKARRPMRLTMAILVFLLAWCVEIIVIQHHEIAERDALLGEWLDAYPLP